MPSNQQRRDAERLRLQRQLEARRERELAHRRRTLIASIVGTLVLLGGVIAIIAVLSGGSGTPAAGKHHPTFSTTIPSPTGALPSPKTPTYTQTPPTPTPTPPPAPNVPPPNSCAKPAKGTTATFAGVTVKGATDLRHAPQVSARSGNTPKTLECGDLVVGKGTAATATSNVTVQYTGVLYKNGKVFDSSWLPGRKPASFPLTGVVPGFNWGIAGHGKVSPMRVGGRRIIILPPAMAYGSQARQGIPANSTLVFVVDLLKVSG